MERKRILFDVEAYKAARAERQIPKEARSAAAQRAKDMLNHYFRLAIEGCGKRWDSDMGAEIDSAVDDIITAAGG